MATKEFWIQLENRAWDMSPHNINRMTGETMEDMGIAPEETSLRPAISGTARRVTMFEPVNGEALILRRYTEKWGKPDDRKVNPWDLNEPDPTENGTMGTIPGPTIECNVGDEVIVHFRNWDVRDKPMLELTHSLHPHGIVFAPEHDGAYPLSPPDKNQPIGEDEKPNWASIGVEGAKQGDRVPPKCTFTYRWNTFNWPSTAGVWLYHDHSVCDHHNVLLGAIGFLVIHNEKDEDDVPKQDLPPGGPNGELTTGGKYVKPPYKALYLQLYHEMPRPGPAMAINRMAINGRRWLGNTPTLIGGLETKMRFGLVAMNHHAFHTFHLHGHRWVIPGPQGSTPREIENSAQITAVSQFEDTKIFGPANAFSFTINQGSFMGPPRGGAKGEWHMHCHVLGHMVGGMMGSLLIVEENQPVTPLPIGKKCPVDVPAPPEEGVAVVNLSPETFDPSNVTISAGQKVRWVNTSLIAHTVTSNTGGLAGCTPISDESFDSGPMNAIVVTFEHTFNTAGTFHYHCEVHGCPMAGTVTVTVI